MLDAFAGLHCVNVGYGRTEIAEVISKPAHELAYYHTYMGHGTEASITSAKMVLDRAPVNMLITGIETETDDSSGASSSNMMPPSKPENIPYVAE